MGMENLESILDGFENSVKESRGRIHERTFEEVFKPVFEGRIGDNARLIEKWVELAGTPYASVDLIGDDGLVSGTVSGILEPIDNGIRENYKDVLKRYETATSVLRINPIRAKAMEDNITAELKQGLLPPNAKSREYVTYYNNDEEVDSSSEDVYDI